ncbi:MAG: NAD(P)H-dependent oxidoreductase subunit E [Burkholderiaceae bacterium]|nr:NAD(P)H-dependent oxidoreductase subunit E [Burkholderiaceae bacterium]
MSVLLSSPAAVPAVTTVPVEALRRGARHRLKGRQPEAADLAAVQALIGPGPQRRDLLIEHLHRLNDADGALREGRLVALAALMKLSIAEVAEVASFYHHFEIVADDAALPAASVRVCDGLSCRLAGADALQAGLQALGEVASGRLRVLPAPCVGRCEQAPVAVLGQRPLPRATPAAVQALLDRGELGHALPIDDGLVFDPLAYAGRGLPLETERISPACSGYAAYRAAGGYRLAAAVVQGEVKAEAVLAALDGAGLRGLGGAGFPAARKWRIVRGFAGPRQLVVNLDEGEPGTFKDRAWLERDPHRLFEGLLIAAQVVGCGEAWIYLRDEYAGLRALLARELARLQADPPCALPRIELRRGAGAYICGEESALLESLEGRRGEPRLRPPYIAERGLFGAPTLAHNGETLYWLRDIVERGPQVLAAHGRHARRGLRSFSVSGRVREPGVKLAPAGITLRELVDEFCGGLAPGWSLYGYLPGGASGGILPAALADVPLDFDTLQPHGCFIGSAAVVVLGAHADGRTDLARDAALDAMRFMADESCGQCTPCRVGTARAAALMAQPHWDLATLDDLGQVMAEASICGLGQAAPNALRCVMRHFPQELA